VARRRQDELLIPNEFRPSPPGLSSASSPLSSSERIGESFQAGSAGALEEDDVVVAEERAQWRERGVEVGKPEAGGAAGRAVEVGTGAGTDGDEQVDSEFPGLSALGRSASSRDA
jgi:hypothetical protein